MPAVRKNNQNMRQHLQPYEAYENPSPNVSQTPYIKYTLIQLWFTAM